MMTLRQYIDAMAAKAEAIRQDKRTDALIINRWESGDHNAETYEWMAWMAYWKAIGARATVDMAGSRERWTVPARLPQDFDPTYLGLQL